MTGPRVIIDTDPGVDDAAAILAALSSPDLDLVGITVVAGNVALADALGNACRIVGLSGRCDVPVHAGAPGPLVRKQIFGKYAAIGAFPAHLVPGDGVAPAAGHGIAFIVRQALKAAASGTPLTLCAIGPLTNVALALLQHPAVAQGIGRIVSMGGTFAVPAHCPPWAEFNVNADPHAAAIVYNAGIPLVLMPLDVTTRALFTRDHICRMERCGTAAGAALAGLLTHFDRSDPARYGRPGGPLHDPMTIAWLLRPDLFRTRPARLTVHVDGAAAGSIHADYDIEASGTSNTLIATDVDEPGYIAWLIERLAASRTASQGGAAA